MEGKISIRNQQKQIIISKLLPGNLEEMTRDLPAFIYIKLTSDRNQEAVLPYLKVSQIKIRRSTDYLI